MQALAIPGADTSEGNALGSAMDFLRDKVCNLINFLYDSHMKSPVLQEWYKECYPGDAAKAWPPREHDPVKNVWSDCESAAKMRKTPAHFVWMMVQGTIETIPDCIVLLRKHTGKDADEKIPMIVSMLNNFYTQNAAAIAMGKLALEQLKKGGAEVDTEKSEEDQQMDVVKLFSSLEKLQWKKLNDMILNKILMYLECFIDTTCPGTSMPQSLPLYKRLEENKAEEEK